VISSCNIAVTKKLLGISKSNFDWNVETETWFPLFLFDHHHPQAKKNNMLIEDKGQEAVCGHAAASIGNDDNGACYLAQYLINNACTQYENIDRTSRTFQHRPIPIQYCNLSMHIQ
jgi:hypothetical protein